MVLNEIKFLLSNSRKKAAFSSPYIPNFKTQIIIIGPWVGEVGPELQYWIPFLQKLKEHGFFENKKLIVISRGGVESWYKNITQNYIDLFNYFSRSQYQRLRSEIIKYSQKQTVKHSNEKIMEKKITESLNIHKYDILHPSVMWTKVQAWLQDYISTKEIVEQLSFRPISGSTKYYQTYVDNLNLPKEYYVVRFYNSSVFQINKDIRKQVEQLVHRLSKLYPIVIMQMDYSVDDHRSIKIAKYQNTISIDSDIPLERNLGIQTEIVRRSKGFIGTNGGFSVLPGLLNKPTISFTTGKRGEYMYLYSKHEDVTQLWNEKINNSMYVQIDLRFWNELITKLLFYDN